MTTGRPGPHQLPDLGGSPPVGVPDVLRHHGPVQRQEQSIQGLARDPVQDLRQDLLVGLLLDRPRGHGRSGSGGGPSPGPVPAAPPACPRSRDGPSPQWEMDLRARHQAGVPEHLPGGGHRIEGVGFMHQGGDPDSSSRADLRRVHWDGERFEDRSTGHPKLDWRRRRSSPLPRA